MPRIFLSYRQRESQSIAQRLCERLREHYGSQGVFLNLGQVPLGSDFRQVIAHEVGQSDAVVVLMGARWLETLRSKANQSHDFVRTEIEMALERGLLTVPVLIGDETAMPREEELPPRMARLAYLQGFRLQLSIDFEGQVQSLISGLDHALSLRTPGNPELGASGEDAAGPPPSPPVPPRKRRVTCAGLELIWVEAGTFWMGSPDGEPGRWADEGPRHQVTISQGFWLGTVPVTQRQFSGIVESNPSFFQAAGEDAPVETVSWRDAREYCRHLQRKEPAPAGYEYRLPCEVEWEYACRAGSQSALYSGPIEIRGTNHAAALDGIAWYGGNSGVEYEGGVDSSSWYEKQYGHTRAGTHPVAQKVPNAWGFFDMLGNVWEWCWDGKRVYPGVGEGLARGPAESGQRVIRGGSWEDGAGDCRCATRFTAGEGHRFAYIGFRLALAPVLPGEEGVRPGGGGYAGEIDLPRWRKGGVRTRAGSERGTQRG